VDYVFGMLAGILSLTALYYLIALKGKPSKPCPERSLQLIAGIAIVFFAAVNLLPFFGLQTFSESIETIALTMSLLFAALYYKMEEPK